MRATDDQKTPARIAALFQSEEPARLAANSVMIGAGLSEFQVRILTPRDGALPRREVFRPLVPPDVGGSPGELAHSRTLWATIFGVIGVLVWWTLQAEPWIAGAPFMSLVTLAVIGVIAGVVAADAPLFNPHDSALFHEVRAALRAGGCAVIFHPANAVQAKAIATGLRARSDALRSEPVPGTVDPLVDPRVTG